MKKSVKGFSANTVSKDVEMVLSNKIVGGFWESEARDTTKFDNIDIEEKFLVEETSVDYGERDFLEEKNNNQTPKKPKIVTKQALGKLLDKINFLGSNDNNILLDGPVVFPPLLKNLVNISVRKSFALDINLDNVVGKSTQEKLVVVRKLFSKINGFGGASTPSKFAGIIRVLFTSNLSLAQTSKKTEDIKILVNTDLKKPSECSDQAVMVKKIPVGTLAEAVHAALSEFGFVVLIKIQLVGLWQKTVVEFTQSDQADLHRALLYTLLTGTNAHNIWDFIGSVGVKTCVINCHPVTYAWARCTIVCFESADSLNAVIETTPVLKSACFHWSYFGSAVCMMCEKLGHTSLVCASGENFPSDKLPYQALSDADKSRLAAIYAKHSALVAWPVTFGSGSSSPPLSGHNSLVDSGFFSKMKPTLQVSLELNNRFAALEYSLASLTEYVDKLAKRLDSLKPTNQGADIVINKSSSVTISGETVAGAVVFDSLVVSKMEKTLKNLLITVMGLSAKIDNAEFLGAGVAIIMNNSLAHHVSKVEEIPGYLISVRLLFKGKLSVTILGLYTGALSETRFGQAIEINSFIVKALNSSTFVVLDNDFNKNNSKKSASFRFCLDLGLVNSFGAYLLVKAPTWSNSRGVEKTIDYIFVNSSLSLAVADQNVVFISDYFNTNYKAVVVLIGLGGLLDIHLNTGTAVAKLVKSLQSGDASRTNALLNVWLIANNVKALEIQTLMADDASSADIVCCLSRFRKGYCCSKMHESKAMEAAVIRHAIDRKMENFCSDKGHMIRSILDKSFCKVVFNHLVVDNKLVLDSGKACQYAFLQHVDDNAFSDVMNIIGFDEFFQVVKHLPDGEAAGLSGIPNEL
ncbi:hypothetical protein G9A89_009066 [Geosiphon pyriformis]|nr:hypothetical protein G9A89_009066 [Geosiphon pyriformis]